MHARFLNAISVVTGTGFTIGLFLSISHFLDLQESSNAGPSVQADLDTVLVAMPPPPPPPKEEKPSVVADAIEAVPLGFEEEQSLSPVKIAPSPPSIEQLLPMSQMPTHVVSGSIGIDTSFKPNIDSIFDPDHVYQKTEVDKLPFVVTRSDPSVPISLLGKNGTRTVILVFVVDTHGTVGNARVLRSSDSPEFDSIIAQSVREWTFSPAIKQGRPVRCLIQQLIKVQMGNRDAFSL